MAAITLALALAVPAHATQDALPGLYDVTGVAADDVLNIRDAPSARASIVGTLSPDAERIEVVEHSDDARWGRVNTAERSGWASLAFLVPRPGEWSGRIPDRLSCFGTEPFWSLSIAPETQVLDRLGEAPLTLDAPGTRVPAAGRRDRWSLSVEDGGQRLTAVVTTRACSDGMSDRAYGLSADVLLGSGDGHDHLAGCCSLLP